MGKRNKQQNRVSRDVNIITFDQSSENGSLTFWLAIKKSTTGPGCIIMVVDTSGKKGNRTIGKKTEFQEWITIELYYS